MCSASVLAQPRRRELDICVPESLREGDWTKAKKWDLKKKMSKFPLWMYEFWEGKECRDDGGREVRKKWEDIK